MCPVWYGNDARASQSPSICMQWIDNIQLYNRVTVRNRTNEYQRESERERAGCECTTTRRQTTSTSLCARADTRLRDYTSWQSLSARRSRRVPRASPAAAAIVASSTTARWHAAPAVSAAAAVHDAVADFAARSRRRSPESHQRLLLRLRNVNATCYTWQQLRDANI